LIDATATASGDRRRPGPAVRAAVPGRPDRYATRRGAWFWWTPVALAWEGLSELRV